MMEALMDRIKLEADAAVALHQDQNHDGSRRVIEAIKLLLDQADEYQQIKQRKLEAYLNG
jgi:hypothetical protein